MADLIITGMSLTGGGMTITLPPVPSGAVLLNTFGGLWTWGQNSYGQLALNNTITKSSPVQTIMGGTNWAKVFTSGDNPNQEVVGAIRSA